MCVAMDFSHVIVYVILVLEAVFYEIEGEVRNINMCRRNIMIRRDILLYHDISDLDLQLDDVTCQCDLYTPPYKGCVSMKAQNMDTLSHLTDCEIQRNHGFSIDNTSCTMQYRVNEAYDNCTHNITVLVVVDKVLQEPVKEWLLISATDKSGVYVNCKWTGTLTTVTYDTQTMESTTESPITTQRTESTPGDDLVNTTCSNCTRPSVPNHRKIKLSEVADQIDIIIATGSGFVVAFLVIALFCTCRGTQRKGKMVVTPVKPKETVVQLSVAAEIPTQSNTVYDNVFVETCSAEIKRDGSGSYSEPASNVTDDENTDKYVHIVRRSSNDCYDNIAFET